MYTIYEIPGVKVGCTSRSPEIRVKQQGYTQFRVIEEVADINIASEREIYWQEKLGYGKDTTSSYANTLEKVKLAHKPEVRVKAIETFRETVKKSEKFYKSRLKGAEKHKKPIMQLDMGGNFIRDWDSALEASKYCDISRAMICHALKGRLKTAGGYIWKYKSVL